MPDIAAFTDAISLHAWPVVAGFVLLALVWLGRLPQIQPQWYRLPAPYRPLVPIVLGLVSGVAEALASSRPWLPALLAGLAVAIPAALLALPSPVIPGQTVVAEPSIDGVHVTIRREPTRPE